MEIREAFFTRSQLLQDQSPDNSIQENSTNHINSSISTLVSLNTGNVQRSEPVSSLSNSHSSVDRQILQNAQEFQQRRAHQIRIN